MATRTSRDTQNLGAVRPPLQRLLVTNLGWILVSLALALVVWYLATVSQNPIVQQRLTQRLPIEVLAPEGYIITQQSSQSVQVTVRTLESIWNELSAEDFRISADLSSLNIDPGAQIVEGTVRLHGELLNGRQGAVVDIVPNSINVTVAMRGEKIVSIRVIPAQDPPVGFIASNITASETQVKVVGPRMLVERVSEARATVNLQNQSVSFVRNLTLRAIGADNTVVEGVTLEPAEITVSVTVQERDDVTGLQVVPNYAGTPAEGYQLKSDNWTPRRIFVRGDTTMIAAMNGVISTEPIDLSGRDQTFTQTVRLSLPTGVTMPDPTDIEITVIIEPVLITREFSGIAVQTQGLDPADYIIVVKPDRVRVRITGPQRIVSALTQEDISVFAPLTGLPPGRHLVTLEASVSAAELATGNIAIPDEQVEVEITARATTPAPTVTGAATGIDAGSAAGTPATRTPIRPATRTAASTTFPTDTATPTRTPTPTATTAP